MTAFTPPDVHAELALLDEIERELVALTTAELAPAFPNPLRSVIPANTGTHAECEVPTESEVAATQLGYGVAAQAATPAPGVMPAGRRHHKHHRDH